MTNVAGKDGDYINYLGVLLRGSGEMKNIFSQRLTGIVRFISTDVNPGIALTGIPKIGTKSTGSKSLQPDFKIKIQEICCFTGGSAKLLCGRIG